MAERQSTDHAARARLQRSLRALAIGNPQATEDMRAELAALAASEMSQHVHSSLRGAVSPTEISWADVDLEFPYPFLMAVHPTASDSTLKVPTFSAPGVEVHSGPDLVVHHSLRKWQRDDSDFITGARVRVGAYAPGSAQVVRVDATLHFTFVGYAAPTEDDSQG